MLRFVPYHNLWADGRCKVELELIKKSNWLYSLYKNKQNEMYILSVVCGTAGGIYTLNIPLGSALENKDITNEEYLNEIAQTIRSRPNDYTHKSVSLDG